MLAHMAVKEVQAAVDDAHLSLGLGVEPSDKGCQPHAVDRHFESAGVVDRLGVGPD
ncbi:hypothetical protein ABH940_006498 [Streptacidiphilus sp. BW17]